MNTFRDGTPTQRMTWAERGNETRRERAARWLDRAGASMDLAEAKLKAVEEEAEITDGSAAERTYLALVRGVRTARWVSNSVVLIAAISNDEYHEQVNDPRTAKEITEARVFNAADRYLDAGVRLDEAREAIDLAADFGLSDQIGARKDFVLAGIGAAYEGSRVAVAVAAALVDPRYPDNPGVPSV